MLRNRKLTTKKYFSPAVLLLIFVLISLGFASDRTRQVVEDCRLKYLDTSHRPTFEKHYESVAIREQDRINSNVLVVRGDLRIAGQVKGDVLVLWGNVKVLNSGLVEGNVTSVNGKIFLVGNAQVSGEMLETSSKAVSRRSTYRGYYNYNAQSKYYRDFPSYDMDEKFLFRYNRVEGVFLGLEYPKQYSGKFARFYPYGSVGYGFETQKVRYQAGLSRYLAATRNFQVELGAEIYDLTDTKDSWRLSQSENSLAAALFKEDFYDFFRREGFTVYLNYNFGFGLRAGVSFLNDDYESLENHTNWSLFGSGKTFRLNPGLYGDEGNMRSLRANLTFDNLHENYFSPGGQFVSFEAEVSSSELGGDFSFNRYWLDIRHFQPVTRWENLNMRLLVGSSEGELPFQKNFELGGLSTLRGYRYKQFSGSSMVLLNMEYQINPTFFVTEIPFFDDHFSIILFTDFGDAWNAPENYDVVDRLKIFKLENLNNDVGFAIAHPRGDYRINFAKSTSGNADDFVITFRILRPF